MIIKNEQGDDCLCSMRKVTFSFFHQIIMDIILKSSYEDIILKVHLEKHQGLLANHAILPSISPKKI